MHEEQTQAKTIFPIVLELRSPMTRVRNSNNSHYGAASNQRNFIDNVEMNGELGIRTLPQNPLVILLIV